MLKWPSLNDFQIEFHSCFCSKVQSAFSQWSITVTPPFHLNAFTKMSQVGLPKWVRNFLKLYLNSSAGYLISKWFFKVTSSVIFTRKLEEEWQWWISVKMDSLNCAKAWIKFKLKIILRLFIFYIYMYLFEKDIISSCQLYKRYNWLF